MVPGLGLRFGVLGSGVQSSQPGANRADLVCMAPGHPKTLVALGRVERNLGKEALKHALIIPRPTVFQMLVSIHSYIYVCIISLVTPNMQFPALGTAICKSEASARDLQTLGMEHSQTPCKCWGIWVLGL